jgi:hypothetical protein
MSPGGGTTGAGKAGTVSITVRVGGGAEEDRMMFEHTRSIPTQLLGADEEPLIAPGGDLLARSGASHECAMFEELSFVRREAQVEADLAYGDWQRSVSAEAYTVYRAAQDRADAAQDQLAECWRRMVADTTAAAR